MNKHIEAAAAAIYKTIDWTGPVHANVVATAQAAYNAIVESLASAGEDGVVEAMRFAHSEYEDHKHGMRAALAVARLSMGEVERDAERYRWLRDIAPNAPAGTPAVWALLSGDQELIYGSELDERVDAARAKEAAPNE